MPVQVSDAPGEMERVLRTRPAASSSERGWTALHAFRWEHAALHAETAPMLEHTVMAYFDTPRRIERATGGKRVRSLTANGSVTIIPAGQTARWDVYGSLRVVHLYIPPGRLLRSAEGGGRPNAVELVDRVAEPDTTLCRLIGLLAEALDDEDQDTALFADSLGEAVCSHLLRKHVATATGLGEPPQNGGYGLASWQLNKICDFLTANLDRVLSLSELADLVDLTPKYLCTAFRLSTGLPPHAWARRLRVERAKSLLAKPHVSLSEIAFTLGYGSQAAFATAFRRETGWTPSQWRRSL